MTIELTPEEYEVAKSVFDKAINDYADMIIFYDINGDNDNAHKYEKYFDITINILKKIKKTLDK